MATWTTAAKVARHLEADHGLILSTYIAEASSICQADLEPFYWPFPDATNAPSTPVFIQEMVSKLAASIVLLELGRINELSDSEDERPLTLRRQYERMRDDLRNGRSQIELTKITNEDMTTFGVDPLGDNQYKLNPGGLNLEGFEVMPQSVIVSGYQVGVDYYVAFSVKDRAWLFNRINGAIVNGTDVTYRISYLRKREQDKITTDRVTRLVLA